VIITFGNHDHHAGIWIVQDTSVGGGRHHIKIDANRTGHDDGLAREIMTNCDGCTNVFDTVTWRWRLNWPKHLRSDEVRVLQQAPTQPTFGGQATKRVGLSIGATDGIDACDDRLKRFRRRKIAVNHCECFTVVATHADFKSRAFG
jgi:hypothetical protein